MNSTCLHRRFRRRELAAEFRRLRGMLREFVARGRPRMASLAGDRLLVVRLQWVALWEADRGWGLVRERSGKRVEGIGGEV